MAMIIIDCKMNDTIRERYFVNENINLLIGNVINKAIKTRQAIVASLQFKVS